jgi:glycerol-3-phosphate cytidylyltransferase-like family protein
MSDEERYLAVESCKWVDLVVKGTPYVMDSEYIKYITQTYKVRIYINKSKFIM